jgi:hypothetical protein
VKTTLARPPLIAYVTPHIIYGIIATTCLLLLLAILISAYGWSFESGCQDCGPIRLAR